MTVPSRDVQRRGTAVAFFSRRLKGARPASQRRCAFLRASCKEQGHHGLVTALTRDEQRRGAERRHCVFVRASCKERGHRCLVTLVERFDIEPFPDFSAKLPNFIGLVLICIDAKFCK